VKVSLNEEKAKTVGGASARSLSLGGRLDVLNGKTVAALVYGRRKHVINVFVSPADTSARATPSGESQGYHWLAWRNGGFDFLAVSDVNPADLQQLGQLFRNP
jgi:anti-sigma factor RsiW